MRLDFKEVLRTALFSFLIMVLVQTVGQLVNFGSAKSWIEIVGFAAVFAVLYALVTNTNRKQKA